MRFLKLTIAYDGTDFAGWQVQPNARTIQQTLEDALQTITGEQIRVTASGRTDAGVHAYGQVVSLATESSLSADVLCRALNANTPHDLVVLDVAEASDGFHAIRDAVRKRYRYVIHNNPLPDVFSRAYAWHIPQPLDLDSMRGAAKLLIGTRDFASFQAAGSDRATTVRTVSELQITCDELTSRILMEVEADGFLYMMVRNIVGSLVEIGRGNHPVDWISEVLAARDRRLAGATAPPHGLFLVSVDYE